jgi:spore coat polysaccharide biosynthesis protein SpsF
MRVICTVQARMSSRRLPGKILKNLGERPTLEHLIESLAHAAGLDGIVIATSTDPSDDPTAAFALERQIACFRGSLPNVALRILGAGEEFGADAVVRISADSPFLDPTLVDQALRIFRNESCDVVTNVRPRTFPRGQSVEVIALTALRRATEQMATPEEREHVTPYLYAHPAQFAIRSFVTPDGRPEVQLSIDDAEDHRRCAAILDSLPGPPWQVGWRACVAAYDAYLAVPRNATAK